MLSNFNLQPMRQRSRGNRRSRKEFYIPIPKAEPSLPDRKPNPKRKADFRRQFLEYFIGGVGFAGGVLTVMVILMYLFRGAIQ